MTAARLTAAWLLVAMLPALSLGQSGSVFVEDLTWPEIQAAIAGGKTTAIYYAGSTEQNGPHMALGKHNFIARYVADRVARELGNALVYPIVPYAPTGDRVRKTEHMRFPGSVTLTDATFGAVAREVALSAIAAGFKTVLLMGDHGGGQDTLARVAADLDHASAPNGARVYYVADAYSGAQKLIDDYLVKHGMTPDLHAGIDDTSELMFLDHDQQWIRRDKLAAGDDKNGVAGDPRQASAQLGKIFLDFKVNAAVAQVCKLARNKE